MSNLYIKSGGVMVPVGGQAAGVPPVVKQAFNTGEITITSTDAANMNPLTGTLLQFDAVPYETQVVLQSAVQIFAEAGSAGQVWWVNTSPGIRFGAAGAWDATIGGQTWTPDNTSTYGVISTTRVVTVPANTIFEAQMFARKANAGLEVQVQTAGHAGFSGSQTPTGPVVTGVDLSTYLSPYDGTTTPPVAGDRLEFDGANWVPDSTLIQSGRENMMTDASGLVVLSFPIPFASTPAFVATRSTTAGTTGDRSLQIVTTGATGTSYTIRIMNEGSLHASAAATFDWIAMGVRA